MEAKATVKESTSQVNFSSFGNTSVGWGTIHLRNEGHFSVLIMCFENHGQLNMKRKKICI